MISLNKIIRNDIKSGVQNFEYLINIDNEVFVATRKQMLKTVALKEATLGSIGARVRDIYFEDAGMIISDLSEGIDLKTKKPQLANVSITFANFNLTIGGKEKRFSDQFNDLLGKEIKIYFKTQSCKSLLECLLVSQLKITRINHDHKQIKISANDLSIDSTLRDIPSSQNVLLKDINTFDHYSLKPVPTLYGHLESAPAIVYKEEDGDSFEIKLLPDTSYLDGSEIGGVARFNTDGSSSTVFDDSDGEFGGYIINNKLQLVRQNVVKIGLGDHLCDIPCLPYQQTRDKITSGDLEVSHQQSQWFSYGNYIVFNNNAGLLNEDNTIDDSTLWCSINEKPISQDSKSYHIRELGNGGFEGCWFYGSQEEVETEDESKTMQVESVYKSNNPSFLGITMGVQTFKFKPLSGHEVNDKEDEDGKKVVKEDIHFLGSLKIDSINHSTELSSQDLNTHIHSTFSSPLHDDDAVGIQSFADNVVDHWSDSVFKHKPLGFPSSIIDELSNNAHNADEDFAQKFRRASVKVRGADDVGAEVNSWTDYRSSFLSQNLPFGNDNSFTSEYHKEGYYPKVDASIMSLYYFGTDANENDNNLFNFPLSSKTIMADWRDLEIRKVWSNKKIFEKDFFVNAKGKLGDIEPNVKDISGHMVIKHEGLAPAYGNNDEGADNLHFTELYKLLTNAEYKTKTINGEVYEIMLASYDSFENKYNFVFDIQIEDLHFAEENLPTNIFGDSILYPMGTIITHNTGWILKFNGKYFGDEINMNYSGFRRGSNGVRLVYGKKIYENSFVSNIDFVEDESLSNFNDNNYYDFPFEGQEFPSVMELGYTTVFWQSEAQQSKKLIERPHEIIQHLLSDQNADIKLDDDKINTIYEQTPEYKMGFSINKRENTNDIIQKICQQSPIYYRYRGRDKKIVVDMMKTTYSDFDLNGIIDVQKLTNFSFDKTKIEDSCMGGVIVNYGYNYSTEDYDKRTPKRDTGEFKSQYKKYYGVDDLSSYELEIDAPYIQDKATAELFRDYYFELNKQQKLRCKFELPISDGISYEVGDIIKFNENPNNTKPYGKDIKSNHKNIDQDVLRYFFITKVQKSLFRTKIECVQTHELAYRLPPVTLLGDVNLSGGIESGFYEGEDLWILNEMAQQGADLSLYTPQQLANADMNGDGVIDVEDVLLFIETFGGELS
tara:strand:+ start:969 stop:4487 length:3519 start_codon:yes stop_codon:yes gene_type:complete